MFRLISHTNFNPRSHKGSDANEVLKYKAFSVFQSTLPQGERLTCCLQFMNLPQTIEISTHAPARGATIVRLGHFFIVCYISTHAPARGATQIFWFCMQNHRNFNPRSRKGSDLQLQCYQHQYWNFNPRSRKGSDVFIFWKCH